MYQNNQNRSRRFRRRPNGGKNDLHGNGDTQTRLRPNSFSGNPARNYFRVPQSAEKLFEKYNTLAKEALTSGDRTLSENYFQHADHFMRVIENKNINQNQNRAQANDKQADSDKHLAENSSATKDKTMEKKEVKKE